MGRQEAFEIFRRDYHHNQTIEENKALLKHKYAEAKSLGETVNQARTKISTYIMVKNVVLKYCLYSMAPL